MQHKDVGYNKDKVLIVSNMWMLGKNQEIFRRQLQADPRVESLSGSRFLPAGGSDNNNFFITTDEKPDDIVKTLRYEVDENYLNTLGIKLKEGRNFSPAFGTDSNAVILNETAVKTLGLQQKAIGSNIYRTSKAKKETYTVIGVVKDFHFRSLHEQISPLLMVYAQDNGNLIMKLTTKDASAFVAELQKRFTQYGAEDPMEYSFLDTRFNAEYKMEQKAGTILAIFAGLTIFVACMGLFGLAKFMAQQRKKEIGIRKVLGASVTQLSTMLSKEFVKLVLIACLIAFPLAWWAMQEWLKEFAYRIDIGWWMFGLAGIIALLIAMFTVSSQAFKAAVANPINSLRTE
jgi:putative ABC transport system permease protein